MTFREAIDLFVADMRGEGRINSVHTERAYRDTLALHADDVANLDPRELDDGDYLVFNLAELRAAIGMEARDA